MTAPTFPAGISWQAVILAMLNLSVDPQIGAKTTPNADLELIITPQIGTRPPALLNLIVSPAINFGVGGSGALNLAVQPSIGVIGSQIPLAVLNLKVIPSMGVPAWRGHATPQPQINAAVTRAATI